MSLPAMKVTLGVLTLSCLVALASSIVCHQCQYAKCADAYDYNPKNLGDCGDDMYCVKYKTIVWIKDSGEIRGSYKESSVVTRTCESSKGAEEGCDRWQNNGGVSFKCWCGSDGCNGGRSVRPVLTSLVFAFVLAFLGMVCSLYH